MIKNAVNMFYETTKLCGVQGAKLIELIVTCSRSKCQPATTGLKIRSMAQMPINKRVISWISRLKEGVGEQIPVSNLYKGDSWANAMRACHRVVDSGGSNWVCSAGYGLVPQTAKLFPYSATFSPGDPDTIVYPTRWWEQLASWNGPSPGHPRLIKELVAIKPNSLILVVVSRPYLIALTQDLICARNAMRSPSNLIIICVGAPKDHPLDNNILQCDSRIQNQVGGALISINNRIASTLLSEIPESEWSADSFQKRVTEWMRLIPPRISRAGKIVTDENIKEFISQEFIDSNNRSKTSLLKTFRQRGNACLDARFARIFSEVQAENCS
jgi:hypothetical protein